MAGEFTKAIVDSLFRDDRSEERFAQIADKKFTAENRRENLRAVSAICKEQGVTFIDEEKKQDKTTYSMSPVSTYLLSYLEEGATKVTK